MRKRTGKEKENVEDGKMRITKDHYASKLLLVFTRHLQIKWRRKTRRKSALLTRAEETTIILWAIPNKSWILDHLLESIRLSSLRYIQRRISVGEKIWRVDGEKEEEALECGSGGRGIQVYQLCVYSTPLPTLWSRLYRYVCLLWFPTTFRCLSVTLISVHLIYLLRRC